MKEKHSDIFRLMIVMNRLDGLYRLAANVNDLKLNTLVLLYALDDGLPHTQKQICDDWLIPRTTLNTIVKESVKEGYISLSDVKHSKEKNIVVTQKGKVYIREMMKDVYQAEHRAMKETNTKYPEPFISAVECFADNLQKEFDKKILQPKLK